MKQYHRLFRAGRKRWNSALILCFLLSACQSEEPRLPSASENVYLLDNQLVIPGVNRQRKIRLYLPPDYQQSQRAYPVLYMHDGQNLFDDSTSYAGEWGVDETLDKLHQQGKLSLIVVGIDNGEDKRMNELSPWPNSDYGTAEGGHYMKFIVDVVKPYIDSNYRTLADVNNTAIMGSSMGGLISHYGIFEYSEVFSKAGIFSPSYWYSDKVYEFTDSKKLNPSARLFFLMGEKEGVDMVSDMNRMIAQIKKQGLSETQISASTIKGGEHHESFWRAHFERAILWLFKAK